LFFLSPGLPDSVNPDNLSTCCGMQGTMKRLDFVSLFAGAGGLDLGLEEAGWRCRYASDIDPSAVATLEASRGLPLASGQGKAFQATFIEEADIRCLSGEEILKKAGCRKGEVSLLAGGPPCQSWSSAGHQHGLRDPRGQLFADFVRIADEMGVRWIVFENVRGLLTARGPDGKPGSALELIRKTLLAAGFQTTVSLLNAADYGVPQRRVRLFIIGYREGDEPQFPVPTHSKLPYLEGQGTLPWVTLGECLKGLSPIKEEEIIRPKGKMAKELKDIPPGSGVKSQGKKERTRPGGHWGYKQGAFVADLRLAARTVTASGQQDWVRDPKFGLRRLCPRECATIQTFPDGWSWQGKGSVQYRLIGNAVPPLLAKAIGEAMAGHVRATGSTFKKKATASSKHLAPLPSNLEAAISYTMREERSNGESRRMAPSKRRSRIELASSLPRCCEG
jgi:DNA (cytosine-5)-methyltransferase 1